MPIFISMDIQVTLYKCSLSSTVDLYITILFLQIDSVPSGEQRDEMQGYHNGPEMQGYHNGSLNFSPRHSQIKSVHDSFNSGVFPDSDSGFR